MFPKIVLFLCFLTFGSLESKAIVIIKGNYDTLVFHSEKLNEKRRINIWTPQIYKENGEALPVLYMLDGGIYEDFYHVMETISELIRKGKIKPLILVGIENTERRRDLTGYTENEEDKKIAPIVGGSVVFRSFIKEELIPRIEKMYHCTDDRGIIGESLAGLFVTECFLVEPAIFKHYIAFDPSLWWNDHKMTTNSADLIASLVLDSNSFYFASARTKQIYPHTKQLSKTIKGKKPNNLRWVYHHKPFQKHSTIFKAAKEQALIWTYGD